MKRTFFITACMTFLLNACGGAPSSSSVETIPTVTIEKNDNAEQSISTEDEPIAAQIKTTKSVPQCDDPAMLRVSGSKVVDGTGKEIVFKGVCFGNNVWVDDELPLLHHNEKDYERISKLGMNAVRFYMNYKTFEDDSAPGKYKEAGWKWLDDNVEWAKKHGIYLVLNMHVPQGGFQSQNKGKALWEDASAQDRLVNLWKAIADRYKDEPIVAGYDFLNEPMVSKSRTQWHELAGRLVTEVRQVTPYQIFFIERINGVDGDWKEDAVRNFFLVDDPNVVYEFHFYKPFHYTHQSAPWVDFAAQDTSWPDQSRVGIEWFLMDWETATFSSPVLPAGDSEWAYYEGAPYEVTDERMALGKPVLTCNTNSGKAYFDDVVIEQLDANGKVEKTLRSLNLVTKRGWYFWNLGGKGEATLEESGHGDNSSLAISGNEGDCNLGADVYQVKLEKGKSYRASGWMKGEKIEPHTRCQIRLDIASSQVPLHPWDKGFLAQELDAYLEWGRKHDVPLFLGEWGTITASFEENRGGERWVADMLDLILENNLSFTYHSYHEKAFALYWDPTQLPTEENANEALINVFKEKLSPEK